MKTIEQKRPRVAVTRGGLGAILVAMALVAAPILAQRQAQPRSGSSSSGGSSARHAPSGGSSARSSSGSSSARSSSSSAHRDSSSRGSSTHRPTGSVRRDSHHGYRYPYRPYYYPRFGLSFGYYAPYYYPYSPYYYGYYGRPWGYYPPYGYPPAGVGPSYDGYERQDLGAVALKVRPKTAEVYIDGRYVGTAGSFDGFPGYLWLEPGSYRLELVQDGYANLDRDVEVSPGQVLEFKLRLDRGVAVRPESETRYEYGRYDGQDDRRPGSYPREPRDQTERGREMRRPERRAGGLFLDVRPDDASVYLDGRFVGTGDDVSTSTEPLLVEEGEHTVQVVHPDFETEERTVTVRSGEERRVEVSLRSAGGN